jgi:hypothetical protein
MRPSWLLTDPDEEDFRAALDEATIAHSAFELPAIAEQVTQLAQEHGRFIEVVAYARREDKRMVSLNCFAYALGLASVDEYWALHYVPESDFMEELIGAGQLKARPAEDACAGDMILYRANSVLRHAGLITETSIESKWGEGAIFRHSTLAVPKKYGSELSFFQSPQVEALLEELRRRAKGAR